MPAKRKVGRPKADISPTQLAKLARLSATNREIADFFGVSEDTIERRFAGVLHKSRAQLRISLRRQLLRSALRDDAPVAALIFALKSICGLSDEPKPEPTPVEFFVVAPNDPRIPCGCIQDSAGAKADCAICHGAGVLPVASA